MNRLHSWSTRIGQCISLTTFIYNKCLMLLITELSVPIPKEQVDRPKCGIDPLDGPNGLRSRDWCRTGLEKQSFDWGVSQMYKNTVLYWYKSDRWRERIAFIHRAEAKTHQQSCVDNLESKSSEVRWEGDVLLFGPTSISLQGDENESLEMKFRTKYRKQLYTMLNFDLA